MLSQALKLLPTPAATDYGSNQSPSDGAALHPSLPALVKLLPTPTEGDSTNSRSSTAPARPEGSTYKPGVTLSDVAYEWSGGRMARRSGAGKQSTDLRLSPSFVEWMIGAPQGWSDPDCPLSATEFRCSWASWSDGS
jgi:DNA (cytosine-5)-methyltransferase 1